ncbi:MAG TPA: acetyltransferase [Casimicrobiaceae bacterium]|nr:acetyltransferase [Casimicrobiaceae bacterium]
MAYFDAFNGDADGISSLVQLRLTHPLDSVLVTGTKRDIRLVERVAASAGDSVTVLDVSLAANREPIERLIARGAIVEYFDHHYAGDGPLPAQLVAHIDTSPGVCTGMLVDRHLAGRQRIWAVVAAFGDNLIDEAFELAASLPLLSGALDALKDLGDCMTYNSYSDRIEDALVRPDELARTLVRCADPLRFVAADAAYAAIDEARRRDLALARQARPADVLPGALVYVLPNAPWTRRVRGIFGNEIANAHPRLAHAVLTMRDDGAYEVSVRAPRARPLGADALCRGFGNGGGRAAAAGIDRLPPLQYREFVDCLGRAYPAP